MRTKKKYLQKDPLNKRRKTSKNRLDAGGLLNATGQNIISLGKNAANIASNPLTSLRKGANYLKNKGKYALTYLVNSSDLDRLIYKNSNFIHLVPTEILNNIYYENEVKTGESEIAYAARKTADAARKTKEAAIYVGKEASKAIVPIARETINLAKKGTLAAAKGALVAANLAKETGQVAIQNIWSTINQPINISPGSIADGKYETSLGEVGSKFGRAIDNTMISLDFDRQTGLNKPSIKKQTQIQYKHTHTHTHTHDYSLRGH